VTKQLHYYSLVKAVNEVAGKATETVASYWGRESDQATDRETDYLTDRQSGVNS
jgi:hypothetical protein